MLENWLEPVSRSLFEDLPSGSRSMMGKTLSVYRQEVPDLHNHRVALIGADGTAADAVRRELYGFASPFPEQIADLGNVRNHRPEFLVALIKELLEGQVLPVMIGGSADLLRAQVHAYYESHPQINLAVVDNRVRFSTQSDGSNYLLNQLLGAEQSRISLCSFVGYQRHLADAEVLAEIDDLFFEHISLGQLRANIRGIEPVIRDADALAVHISAFNSAELPARAESSPTGLSVDEGCRISRYAGMSDRLSSISFPGLDSSLPGASITANAVAQMIWYFLEGVFQRKQEYPLSVEGLVEYVVQLKEVDLPVSFWKSPQTGRWWMEPPSSHQKMPLTACSYEDYLETTNGEIPDRLFKAMHRFSE